MTAHVRVSRLSRPRRVAAVFLRLLVVVAAFGLSGLAPAVAEVIACNVAGCDDPCEASGCSDCPLDQDGEKCPPGCPSCHCFQAGVVLLPVAELRVTSVNLDIDAAVVPVEAAVPRAPPASDVYRPPRGVVTFS
ncbi:MAG: hypothetical protein ABI895_24605 [Deltaproteobacteria bacterium]